LNLQWISAREGILDFIKHQAFDEVKSLCTGRSLLQGGAVHFHLGSMEARVGFIAATSGIYIM
jgi:hypothetical protein